MRWQYVVLMMLCACREIEPFSPPGAFPGYQIEGSVAMANGFPVGGAEIRMYYEFDTGYPPLDTVRFFISDSSAVIQVSVLDVGGSLVKSFAPPRRTGYLSRRIWDERDGGGTEARNGLYYIQIYVNDAFAMQYQWLVDAHVTAVTDQNGQFFIPSRHLPVGQIIDLYDSLGVYDGTYAVTASVFVRASTPSAQRTVYVTLTRDAITQVYIIL